MIKTFTKDLILKYALLGVSGLLVPQLIYKFFPSFQEFVLKTQVLNFDLLGITLGTFVITSATIAIIDHYVLK